MIPGVLLVLICMPLFDVPALIRQGQKHDLIVYWVAFGLCAIYLLLFAFGAEFGSALHGVHMFVENTLGLSYRHF